MFNGLSAQGKDPFNPTKSTQAGYAYPDGWVHEWADTCVVGSSATGTLHYNAPSSCIPDKANYESKGNLDDY